MASAPSVYLVAPSREFIDEDGLYTFFLNPLSIPAGQTGLMDSASTSALNGFAVSLDPTANMQVVLTTAGSPIFGRIELVEQRTQTGVILCTVATRFMGHLPLLAGNTPAVGDFLVGAAGGYVQKYVPPAAYTPANPIGNIQCVYTGDEAAGYVSALKL